MYVGVVDQHHFLPTIHAPTWPTAIRPQGRVVVLPPQPSTQWRHVVHTGDDEPEMHIDGLSSVQNYRQTAPPSFRVPTHADRWLKLPSKPRTLMVVPGPRGVT